MINFTINIEIRKRIKNVYYKKKLADIGVVSF